MKDALYYTETNGAVVFGGGEPLLQSDFVHLICQKLDSKIKKRIETSLNAPFSSIEPLINDMDKWIIDIKDINPKIYSKYTDADNSLVLENLEKLIARVGKEKLHIRLPQIPGYNTLKDVTASADYLRKHYNIEPEIFKYIQI